MRAGQLRDLILLQQKTQTGTDAGGDPITQWTDVDRVWADVRPLSLSSLAGAQETILAGAEMAVDLVSVKLYPYPGVTAGWRFLYDPEGGDPADGRPYDIKAPRETNRKDEMVFIAAVGASRG